MKRVIVAFFAIVSVSGLANAHPFSLAPNHRSYAAQPDSPIGQYGRAYSAAMPGLTAAETVLFKQAAKPTRGNR